MKETIKELIKEHKLDGKMQTREKVYKRFYLMGVLYSLNTMPLNEIGKLFNRDHSTVIHGVKQHNKWWHMKDELYYRMIHDLVEIVEPELLSLPKNYYFKCKASENMVTIQGNFTQKMLTALNEPLNRKQISAILAE
jgi:hypothetical protein